MSDRNDTADTLRSELNRWRDNNAQRDQIVLDALAAGITCREIRERTGLSRGTISSISHQSALRASD